jgi:hypothetical protein
MATKKETPHTTKHDNLRPYIHVRDRTLAGYWREREEGSREEGERTNPKRHGRSVLCKLEANEAVDDETPKGGDDEADVDCCEPLSSRNQTEREQAKAKEQE